MKYSINSGSTQSPVFDCIEISNDFNHDSHPDIRVRSSLSIPSNLARIRMCRAVIFHVISGKVLMRPSSYGKGMKLGESSFSWLSVYAWLRLKVIIFPFVKLRKKKIGFFCLNSVAK